MITLESISKIFICLVRRLSGCLHINAQNSIDSSSKEFNSCLSSSTSLLLKYYIHSRVEGNSLPTAQEALRQQPVSKTVNPRGGRSSVQPVAAGGVHV